MRPLPSLKLHYTQAPVLENVEQTEQRIRSTG